MKIEKIGKNIYGIKIGKVSFVIFKEDLKDNIEKRKDFKILSISNKEIEFKNLLNKYIVFDKYTLKRDVVYED